MPARHADCRRVKDEYGRYRVETRWISLPGLRLARRLGSARNQRCERGLLRQLWIEPRFLGGVSPPDRPGPDGRTGLQDPPCHRRGPDWSRSGQRLEGVSAALPTIPPFASRTDQDRVSAAPPLHPRSLSGAGHDPELEDRPVPRLGAGDGCGARRALTWSGAIP